MSVKSLLRSVKYRLMGYSVYPALNTPWRAVNTWHTYIGPDICTWLRWLITSKEEANFTYSLTDRCKLTMSAGLASFLGRDFNEIEKYFREIDSDEELQSHIRSLWSSHPERNRTDDVAKIGRRIVWYSIARATKPKIIVETGVDQGLGAVVLCAALAHNAAEGDPGLYFGTDINPRAGYFLKGKYATFGSILIGDSIRSLSMFNREIDLFINDSHHSAEYEAAEYEVIKSKLSCNGIILGDNSHATSKLVEFSIRERRRFAYLPEEPAQHWYRGAGVGISMK